MPRDTQFRGPCKLSATSSGIFLWAVVALLPSASAVREEWLLPGTARKHRQSQGWPSNYGTRRSDWTCRLRSRETRSRLWQAATGPAGYIQGQHLLKAVAGPQMQHCKLWHSCRLARNSFRKLMILQRLTNTSSDIKMHLVIPRSSNTRYFTQKDHEAQFAILQRMLHATFKRCCCTALAIAVLLLH